MTINKLAFSLVGSLALATTGFAGTSSGKACTKCTAPAPVLDDSLGITLGVGYDSHYIFRGVQFAENWINTSIDWALPLTDKLNFNLGANYGSSADDSFAGFDGASYQRLELAAGITADLGGAELGLGYRWYHHMGDGDLILDDGHEAGLTLATKAGPINIGVGAYYDFQQEGWYFEAGANSEIKICDKFSIVPGVGIGYNVDYNWHIEGARAVVGDGFTAVNVSVGFPIKLTKTATLTPFVAWNLPIDALDDAGENDQIHGGINLSVKF